MGADNWGWSGRLSVVWGGLGWFGGGWGWFEGFEGLGGEPLRGGAGCLGRVRQACVAAAGGRLFLEAAAKRRA